MEMEDTKDILCIVPVFNDGERLEKLLQVLKARYQNLFIIDDCSVDNSTTVIRDAWALPICRHLPGDGVFALYHEEHKGLRKTLLEALEMAASAGFSDIRVVNPAAFSASDGSSVSAADVLSEEVGIRSLNLKKRNPRSLLFRMSVCRICGF